MRVAHGHTPEYQEQGAQAPVQERQKGRQVLEEQTAEQVGRRFRAYEEGQHS